MLKLSTRRIHKCASAQADLSRRCPLVDALDPLLTTLLCEDSDHMDSDKRGYPHNIIFLDKNIFWVLIRSASARRF